MKPVFRVAVREFTAVAMTKAFVLGLLLPPVLLVPMLLVLPKLMLSGSPRISGEVAVVDPTGVIAARVVSELTPEKLAERTRRLNQAVGGMLPVPGRTQPDADSVMARLIREAPNLRVNLLPSDADVEEEKQRLITRTEGEPRRLALIVVHPDAVSPAAGGELGAFDSYVRDGLDFKLLAQVEGAVSRSIVDARLEHRSLDGALIRSLVRVPEARTQTVDRAGKASDMGIGRTMIPMGFVILMMMGIMFASQGLLTSTVEEKSTRVVEILLSAVSPTQLMAGKIIGHLGVGLLSIGIYGTLGIVALFALASLGLVEAHVVIISLVFFILGYAIIGSLMGAIGAAVSDLRDAQALLMPVMLINFLPLMLWMPISMNPGSTLATVFSLTPPFSSYFMVLRLAGGSPPPAWEVAVAIALGVLAAAAALWSAGRIFRIGLLIHGKPPSMATLYRWVRAG